MKKKFTINADGTGQVMTSRGLRLYGATSRHEFVFPILKMLNANKSGLTSQEIRDTIHTEFLDKFNETDMMILKGQSARWIKNLDWAKYQMKNDGFIKENKNNHKWEITKEGVEYYQNKKIN